MATLSQQIENMKTASQEQTQASQALAQEVSGKMRAIDTKVATSIAAVESTYADKAAGLTIIATDGYRKAVEHNSGGKNTVVYDAQGNPNIMVVVPRFNYEDLELPTLELGTGIPTAFQTNGVPRSEILLGKYLASTMGAGTATIGGAQPRTSVNYDQAKELCTRKGLNWHLMSAHEWSAIALWAMANETVPRGNTNWGRSHERKLETGRRWDNRAPGDASGTGATRTGSGPATWTHDHTDFGISDLVGNLYEWVDQMCMQDGRIITTLDNNPAIAEENWTKHAVFMDALLASGGAPKLNSLVTTRQGDIGDDANAGNSFSVEWQKMTKDESYTPSELMRRLLIESAVDTGNATGSLYGRNYGRRFPLRGGSWVSGANAGLGYLDLYNSRVYANGRIGFRPALFV